jgi:hypothetical protein
MCEAVGELTIVQSDHFLLETEPELRLYLDAVSLTLNATKPSAHRPRPAADLVVADTQSSRRHAEIELRGDKFVLIDRSSNGTFVQIDGEREFLLSREEVVLRGAGTSPLVAAAPTAPRSSASSVSSTPRQRGIHQPFSASPNALPPNATASFDWGKNFPRVKKPCTMPSNSCTFTTTPASRRPRHRPCNHRSADRNLRR